MDFKTFKAVKNPQSPTHSFLVEGQIQVRVGDSRGLPMVYQGCDACKREVNHMVDKDLVTCLGCGNSYKIKLVKIE